MNYKEASLNTNVIASYGVYTNKNEEENGFLHSSNYYQKSSPQENDIRTPALSSKPYGWCYSNASINNTPVGGTYFFSWCRPSFLLLFIVFLLVTFVSGFLLYYNYLAHKPRLQIIEEPCEKTFCAWGAQCVTGPDGKALCQCPTKCLNEKGYLCGSDGKTYKNLCELRMASCWAKQNTAVKYLGKCEQNDPCRDKQCYFGAKCVILPDGQNATCICPDKCPNYGDHISSRPVCGTDGVTYNNFCELEKAACSSKTNITMKFAGNCDPCAGIKCTEPEICQLDERRNPICKCGETCPLEFTPVCGSDGKTYSNECTMRREACRRRRTLNIIYRGKCSSGINPCMSVKCSNGEECTINKFGIARCECPPTCEPVMRPVCTQHGRTFSSECEMIRAACLSRSSIEIVYGGVCGEKGPCSDHVCQFGAICVEKSGVAHCECPTCPAEFAPVCGSDGISYGNECKLRMEACKHRRDIRVLYDGPCNGCENKKCEYYSVCDGQSVAEGKCVCPTSCQDSKLNNGTVCGSDGITYSSECELRITSCKLHQYILLAYKGNCDLCKNVECKYGSHCKAGICVCPTNCEDSSIEPMCASNMVTYPNECELQKATCLQPQNSTPLTVIFYGDCRERFPVDAVNSSVISPTAVATEPSVGKSETELDVILAEKEACKDIHCDFEATCELGVENFPKCTCRFDCAGAEMHSVSKPVCASDLRIYPSLCAMKMEACQRQEELRLRPLELCQGLEVKPCNGENPLTDPLTGKELDCGNGPSRKDCPSGSYCHQTVRFSRCCRKDANQIERNCENSWFGCCPNSLIPVQGPDQHGCPNKCDCNKLGSFFNSCEGNTQKCKCRPGVGGEKCDRCEPGYWGLPKISSGHLGCIPCGCSVFGSVREDCEQMTGRCVCRPGVQGHKCTVCMNHDKILGPNGCISPDLSTVVASSCEDLTCYFGATCMEKNGAAICECHTNCDPEGVVQMVCGSDGQTYSNLCQLRHVACRLQKDIVLQAFGVCKDDITSTDSPGHPYTPLQFTQPDEVNSLSKSTRHLLSPHQKYFYDRKGIFSASYLPDGDAVLPMLHSEIARKNMFEFNGEIVRAYRPTPATVHVIAALLGDICAVNSDCVILNSYCANGACSCKPNYIEAENRQECEELKTNTIFEYQGCSLFPCKNNGTCLDSPMGFNCICSANFTGYTCEEELTKVIYEVPAFHGRSFIKMKTLKAYYKLNIEIEFKSYALNGLLFYNQQNTDGSGDFVSVALVDGYVEFKYNLGNGAVTIKSIHQIVLNRFHHVIVKRYHKDGLLKVDDREDVGGQSPGTLKALDLLDDSYLGYIPSKSSQVYENIGTKEGFQGCIKKLKIGRHLVQLQNKEDKIIETENLYNCDMRPCSALPCLNNAKCEDFKNNSFHCKCSEAFSGSHCDKPSNPCFREPCNNGTCLVIDNDTYVCRCPSDKIGKHCEMDITDIISPEFNGSSYIIYPFTESLKKKFTMEILFFSSSLNGLIFYSGQNKNGLGDFISLNIAKGHVQFRFNLGSGIANLTTNEVVTVGKWHRVFISKNERKGTIQLDGSSIVKGLAGAHMTELNLDLPLYIGSVPSWKKVHRLSGVSKGFKGVIQKILLNNKLLLINTKLEDCLTSYNNKTVCSVNVEPYGGLPCPRVKNPCKNDGICLPHLDTFSCKCHSKYSGKLCQIEHKKSHALKFNGATYFQYKDNNLRSLSKENYHYSNNIFYEDGAGNVALYRGKRQKKWIKYEIKLKTVVDNGLILWRGKRKKFVHNSLAMALVDGFVELSYLGKKSNSFVLRSSFRINDGQWHTITVQKRKKIALMLIDLKETAKQVVSSNTHLQANAKLWIGGTPTFPQGYSSSYYVGFVGCIQQIFINQRPLDLPTSVGILNYEFCNDREI